MLTETEKLIKLYYIYYKLDESNVLPIHILRLWNRRALESVVSTMLLFSISWKRNKLKHSSLNFIIKIHHCWKKATKRLTMKTIAHIEMKTPLMATSPKLMANPLLFSDSFKSKNDLF